MVAAARAEATATGAAAAALGPDALAARDGRGFTAAHALAFCRRAPALSAFLGAGADADVRLLARPPPHTSAARVGLGRGAAPLHCCFASHENPDDVAAAAEALVRGGAAPAARDAAPPRRAATHVAATHGAAAACRALLHGGADPNLVDDAGDAPLHLAAAFGSGAVVKILLDHGADPALRDALGHDAKERAVANANTGCALLISKRLSAGGEARGAAARRKLKAEP